MITASQARSVGRQMIRDNKKLLIGAYFAYFGISLALGLVAGAMSQNLAFSMLWSIGSIFVTIPLMLGVLHVYNMVFYRRQSAVGNLFDFFRNYHVSVKVIGVTFIYSAALMFLLTPVIIACLIPRISMQAYSGYAGYAAGFGEAISAGALPTVLVLTALILLVALFFGSISMAVYYIALRNRSISFGQLLSSSLRIGFRYLWKYFVFQLTFLGWGLLACAPLLLALVLGLALTVSTMSYATLGVFILLLIAGMVVSIAAVALLDVYILSSTAVFFNTAIDEYEQQHPESGYTTCAPHVPEPPAGGFQIGEPDTNDAPADEESGAAPAEDPFGAPGETPDAERVEPPVEHIEAEEIAPPDDGERAFFSVILLDAGVARLTVGRILTEVTDCPMGQAQEMIDNAPITLREGLARERAHEIAKLLTDAGARVEIR